jgi:hypothetical protein
LVTHHSQLFGKSRRREGETTKIVHHYDLEKVRSRTTSGTCRKGEERSRGIGREIQDRKE